ncbi:MAG: hypothetical protein GY757_20210, partial [bacterium]|nr:hypothetical protein [bacterium]
MFCSVHKWFISASLDTAKPLPAIVRRHMTHCRSCTDFAAGADSLGNRLVVDGQKLLVHSHRELEERIVSSLPGMISP